MQRQKGVGPEDYIILGRLVRIGRFRLSSGRDSSIYVNLREAQFNVQVFKALLEEVSEIIRGIDADAIVGVATGGIPWATGAGLILGKPSTYVRKKEKGYGESRIVEAPVRGLKVVVVDDVATTGSSILRAVEALRSAGAIVSHAVVVVERGAQARRRLAGAGVKLSSVTTLRRIVARMMELEVYDKSLIQRALREVEEP